MSPDDPALESEQPSQIPDKRRETENLEVPPQIQASTPVVSKSSSFIQPPTTVTEEEIEDEFGGTSAYKNKISDQQTPTETVVPAEFQSAFSNTSENKLTDKKP